MAPAIRGANMTQVHTPGPWAIEKPFQEIGLYVTAANPRRTNPLICYLSELPGKDEAQANARLIAAAPQLLEALEAAVQIIEQLIPEPSARGVAGVVLFQLQAAIASARGVEHPRSVTSDLTLSENPHDPV